MSLPEKGDKTSANLKSFEVLNAVTSSQKGFIVMTNLRVYNSTQHRLYGSSEQFRTKDLTMEPQRYWEDIQQIKQT